MKTPLPDFIEKAISALPPEMRECAAAFMLWFDECYASQEMIASDPIGWRQKEQSLWEGWEAAWNHPKESK